MSSGLPWEVRQTRRFARSYKKLTNAALIADTDAAVATVAQNPDMGERKKGDLTQLWVHKFRSGGQLYLLGYTREDGVRLVYLEALGPHENFYRDLKR
jgi:mRNA-degrading endonuclease RelE of RelBE toxin-antitoxin system